MYSYDRSPIIKSLYRLHFKVGLTIIAHVCFTFLSAFLQTLCLLLLDWQYRIFISSVRLKGTDPLKINQIFKKKFREKYTPFHPLSFGMTTITVGQREVRLAGVQRLRALSERRLSVVLTGVSFILFILYFFLPLTTLQYLIFSTINCPKTS